jgi:hypothetical protein
MFLREVKRQNKNGSHVSYLQLVHNEWDPAAQTSRTKIVHSFGRTDQVDPAAIDRLIASLQRLREPSAAPGTSASSASSVTNGGAELSLLAARPMGGTHLLDGMWHRLGIDAVMTTLLAVRRRDPRTERALFALVANRALNASSKLAAANWVSHDVHIDGLAEITDDACYRAMDWLLEIEDELAQQVYWQVATLLDLEVDLLFFDTTSTYFELDEPDAPIRRDAAGYPVDDPTDGDPAEGDPATGGSDTATDTDTDSAAVGFRTHGKSNELRRHCVSFQAA